MTFNCKDLAREGPAQVVNIFQEKHVGIVKADMLIRFHKRDELKQAL
jgi:hypothetical protein